MIKLKNKIFCIFGLNESGKTYLSQHIARQYNSVIFDVLNEYDKKEFDCYVPSAKQYPDIAVEFDLFLKKLFQKNLVGSKYNLMLIDEANRVFPNRVALQPSFRSFLDEFRHHQIGLGFICRRMTQLFTDIVELAHYIFIFNLKGKNDLQYLNSLNSEIGEIPAKLPQHHFILMKPDRSFEICKPI